MERNVPEAEWLYPDRGMKKWMGWLLSDHSAYLANQARLEQAIPAKPEMAQADIDRLLQAAWEHGRVVSLQLFAQFDNTYLPDATGAIVGYTAGIIYLQRRDGVIQAVDFNDIRHAEPINQEKWWNDDNAIR